MDNLTVTRIFRKVKIKGTTLIPVSLRKILFAGKTHFCPICQTQLRQFWSFRGRPGAWCPICGSLERHRLVWLFLQQNDDILDTSPKRMLHIAPEPILETRFRLISKLDYLSADLTNPQAMVRMDVTDIQFPDSSFDIIFCSHVLEHVPDDFQAIKEFNRVLKPNGLAIVLVPIVAEATFEDPTIEDPVERERLFGHPDHVRSYGPDFKNQLEDASFKVTVFSAKNIASSKELVRTGIRNDDFVFLCRK